jgi:hypothetical protein
MLYNRKLDPKEDKNVIANIEYEKVLKEMRNALKSKQQQANNYK